MLSDVRIEVFDGRVLEETEFEYAYCWVLPFYGQLNSDFSTISFTFKVEVMILFLYFWRLFTKWM